VVAERDGASAALTLPSTEIKHDSIAALAFLAVIAFIGSAIVSTKAWLADLWRLP
jgi:hypothetical protein